MKTLVPLLLVALLCCQCKKNNNPLECDTYCISGFVCDPVSRQCICPEGNYIANSSCIPVKSYMYLPASDNANSDCFKYINAMWIDTSGSSTLLRIAYDIKNAINHVTNYDFSFFPLTHNSDTASTWTYMQEFVSDAGPGLPCQLDGQPLNAHIYVNFDEQIIRMRVDIIPYIAEDWLHWEDYPVLDSYELVYLRYQP